MLLVGQIMRVSTQPLKIRFKVNVPVAAHLRHGAALDKNLAQKK